MKGSTTVIDYGYDPGGNRTYKKVNSNDTITSTFYVRDAQGNVMAIYSLFSPSGGGGGGSLNWDEQHLYGSSRLGMWRYDTIVPTAPPVVGENTSIYDSLLLGSRTYELSNHLGNVLSTISDKKIGHDSSNVVNYYIAEVLSQNDYYPGGMLMPGRKYAAESGYRYGFNGKENDNEVKGEGNQLDYGMRIYDPRVGRWYSTDQIVKPWLSPYQFSSNNPINLSDPDGGDEIHFHYITITRNVSLIRHDATGKAFIETRSISKTYTYLQVIQDHNQDRFFVHRQGKGEPQDIEFYPNVNGGFTKSGVTTSSWYLWKDTKDRDFVSLLKIADDFPELKGQVLPTEISNPNSSGGQHGENRKFWQSFFSIKASHEIRDQEEAQNKEFMVGVLVAAVSELAIARLASFVSKGEIYYRALSKADYESFLTTGNIPATGETFISPTKAFASDYKGVLLEINVKSGTFKKLESMGVRNSAVGHPHSGMPLVESGWGKQNAFFKFETNPSGLSQVNIGLGQGKALQTFNNNIQSVKVIRNP